MPKAMIAPMLIATAVVNAEMLENLKKAVIALGRFETAALGLNAIPIEGSDSLDNPKAAFE